MMKTINKLSDRNNSSIAEVELTKAFKDREKNY
jgi:hypothetical protein